MRFIKSLTLALSISLGATSLCEGKQMLTIINNSSSDISALYLSDSRSNDWEDNLMPGGYVLPSGKQLEINLESKYRKFDLRVESSDGVAEDYMEFPGTTTLIQVNGNGESEYE
ncbi:MAG: hypothetical protein K6F05_02180 [Succinivibrio sp.]|nr:hypothetical protein [Succinivibrio sp.]